MCSLEQLVADHQASWYSTDGVTRARVDLRFARFMRRNGTWTGALAGIPLFSRSMFALRRFIVVQQQRSAIVDEHRSSSRMPSQ
jgi:hypothetical protein